MDWTILDKRSEGKGWRVGEKVKRGVDSVFWPAVRCQQRRQRLNLLASKCVSHRDSLGWLTEVLRWQPNLKSVTWPDNLNCINTINHCPENARSVEYR